MDRREEILKHITREQKGIEVGPWHSPLAAKRDGYRCMALDVFDYDRLVENARNDPNIPPERIERIERVDIMGSTTAIESLISARGELGTFDYIVSSHNFEHIPNPIKFLRGSGAVLRSGGMLSMAIPDKRTCFDFFRPLTTLAAWLEADSRDRDRPTRSQLFEMKAMDARLSQGDQQLASFPLTIDPAQIRSISDIGKAYATWKSRVDTEGGEYHDAHCSTFTPCSFKLLIEDAHHLQLSPFAVEEVSSTASHEFFVHLRNVGLRAPSPAQTSEFYAARQRTLLDIADELAIGSRKYFALTQEERLLGRRAKCRYLLGRITSDALRMGSLCLDWMRGSR